MAKFDRYFVNVGGTVGNLGAVRWGFRAPGYAYDNIGTGMGVVKVADNNRSGIVYGANNPRPPRVRINYVKSVEKTGSAMRFCEADKLNETLFGSVNNLKIKIRTIEYDINNITLVGK